MDEQTALHLLELNDQFYQTFALQFSATRRRIQPGVRRVIEHIPAGARLLDLGCGNGELARLLVKSGFRGRYVGLDRSTRLLEEARQEDENENILFLQANLAEPDWPALLPHPPFDYVLAFAVLHHLPGETLRLKTLQAIHKLLSPAGRFIHSEWQFMNSPRLAARVQPWEAVGLHLEQVDPGDTLLDWRSGGFGLRYVHHFDLPELERLAEQSNFEIVEAFHSDGEEGKLGLYQVWSRRV